MSIHELVYDNRLVGQLPVQGAKMEETWATLWETFMQRLILILTKDYSGDIPNQQVAIAFGLK